MTASEFLDAVDKTTSEATDGPWAHWPEAGSVEITSNKHSDVICGYVKPKSGWGGEVYEDGTEPTAEFIAQSRQWVPAMSAALREVLELLEKNQSYYGGAPVDDHYADGMCQATTEVLAAIEKHLNEGEEP